MSNRASDSFLNSKLRDRTNITWCRPPQGDRLMITPLNLLQKPQRTGILQAECDIIIKPTLGHFADKTPSNF